MRTVALARVESTPDPLLARVLWQCLVVAALLLSVVTLTRGAAGAAFWLVAAPIASLMVLYRHAFAAAWRGILVPVPRRRRLPAGSGLPEQRHGKRAGGRNRLARPSRRVAPRTRPTAPVVGRS